MPMTGRITSSTVPEGGPRLLVVRRSTVRRVTSGAAEVVGGVALATGAVAGLDTVAPIAGLGVVYLLAVLVLAIRRGGIAALATAVLSVLALNYFFIAPIHRLT